MNRAAAGKDTVSTHFLIKQPKLEYASENEHILGPLGLGLGLNEECLGFGWSLWALWK